MELSICDVNLETKIQLNVLEREPSDGKYVQYRVLLWKKL